MMSASFLMKSLKSEIIGVESQMALARRVEHESNLENRIKVNVEKQNSELTIRLLNVDF